MAHYESDSLNALIARLKERQQGARTGAQVSNAPQTTPPTPAPQQRPKTWEEMQLEKQSKGK